MEFLNIAILILLILLVGICIWIAVSGRRRSGGEDALMFQQQLNNMRVENRDLLQRNNEALGASMQRQMDGMRKEMGRLTEQINKDLNAHREIIARTHETLGNRLEGTTKVVTEVHNKLGELHKTTHRLEELSKDIASLQDILRPPKLRGGLGEFMLAELLAQVVPNHFSLQHRFRNNEAVDAVITLGGRLVPIDAKFPIESFKRYIEGADEESRKKARREFIRNVKGKIDDIAAKYIRPEEGTFDFALMYIPAENVYYETIIKDDSPEDAGIFGYSLQKKVIPVSPNTFYSYLQTILLGLRGMKIEERVEEVLKHLQSLRGDFGKFDEDFRTMGKHLKNCLMRYDDASKDLDKFSSRLEHIDTLGETTPARQIDTPKETRGELL